MMKISNEQYFDVIQEKIPELDYEKGLVTCSGDREFYLELLKDFTELTVKDELKRFLKEEDVKSYCIRVHGFKNNAYSIGATEIGDLAYELEKITKRDVFDEVLELQSQMFELYDSVCRRYREVLEA